MLQNRLASGTCGSDRTAEDGSRYGTRGTSTSPAPSMPRRPEEREDPVRVDPVPVGPVPMDPRPADPPAVEPALGGIPQTSQ
ncbi:hypothetical protein Acsp03_45680 [Actinomadura sp. NBRC 104412]|nr:hypothetical protein Acsp03_45680 [Actinomadura sp. NBRC 104412]